MGPPDFSVPDFHAKQGNAGKLQLNKPNSAPPLFCPLELFHDSCGCFSLPRCEETKSPERVVHSISPSFVTGMQSLWRAAAGSYLRLGVVGLLLQQGVVQSGPGGNVSVSQVVSDDVPAEGAVVEESSVVDHVASSSEAVGQLV